MSKKRANIARLARLLEVDRHTLYLLCKRKLAPELQDDDGWRYFIIVSGNKTKKHPERGWKRDYLENEWKGVRNLDETRHWKNHPEYADYMLSKLREQKVKHSKAAWKKLREKRGLTNQQAKTQAKKRCALCLLRIGLGNRVVSKIVRLSDTTVGGLRKGHGLKTTQRRHTHLRTIQNGTAGDPLARQRECFRKSRGVLSDSYVKTKLVQRTRLGFADVTPEMVELMRAQLLAKRELRKKREEHERHSGDAL